MRYIVDIHWPKDYKEWANAKEVEQAIKQLIVRQHGLWPLPDVNVELDPEMER